MGYFEEQEKDVRIELCATAASVDGGEGGDQDG
jgi:hypothetical protein